MKGCSIDVKLYVLIALALLLVWGLYFVLNKNMRLETSVHYRLRRMMAAARQGEKSWWQRAQRWVDGE